MSAAVGLMAMMIVGGLGLLFVVRSGIFSGLMTPKLIVPPGEEPLKYFDAWRHRKWYQKFNAKQWILLGVALGGAWTVGVVLLLKLAG